MGWRGSGWGGEGHGEVKRFRECYRGPWSMEKAREDLRGSGSGGEGQGVWRGPGKGDEVHGE